jgi:hypothetical protein
MALVARAWGRREASPVRAAGVQEDMGELAGGVGWPASVLGEVAGDGPGGGAGWVGKTCVVLFFVDI